MAAEDWTTIRVRRARRAEVVAAAKVAGVSVAVWADGALDAALKSGGAPAGPASAPRRAPAGLAELRRALVEAEMRKAPLCVAILSGAVERAEASA